jgi:peptidyl-prolyl cis-trans isomerase C
MEGRRLFAAPPFHFLLIGALLFCANAWLAARSGAGDRETIEITAAQIDSAKLEWMRLHKAAPTPGEERALIDRMIDQELLFREALRIGLDRSSPVVRRRLTQIAGFVDLDPNAEEEPLLAEARALGLDRDDPIIRSHLIGRMHRLYQRAEIPEEPTEEEVRAFVEQEPHRFMMPERVAFAHVYLSADRRGASLSQDAADLLERLKAESVSPEGAAEQGDVFMRGHDFPLQTRRQVLKVFGPGFAEAVMEQEPGIWAGPLESAYGLHLVWVKEKMGERLPEFAVVLGRARQELVVSRGEERLRERLDTIRGNYEIRVEEKTAPGVDDAS